MIRSHEPRGSLIFFVLIALLTCHGSQLKASSKSGESAATFLRLDQGARAIGMGGAAAALTRDIDAMSWNPAGLALTRHHEVTLGYTQFIEDVAAQYFAAARPLSDRSGAFGASVFYHTIGGLEGYNAAKVATTKLDATAFVGSVAYAKNLSGAAKAGANIKFIGQTLDTEKATGIAADLGIQNRGDRMALGIVVQNLGPKFKIGTTEAPLPMNIRAGLGWRLSDRVTLAGDIEKPSDGEMKPHIGGEWKFGSTFALRAGYAPVRDLGSSTAGLSLGATVLKLFQAGGAAPTLNEDETFLEDNFTPGDNYLFSLDYAYVSYGDLSSAHRLSIGLRF